MKKQGLAVRKPTARATEVGLLGLPAPQPSSSSIFFEKAVLPVLTPTSERLTQLPDLGVGIGSPAGQSSRHPQLQ